MSAEQNDYKPKVGDRVRITYEGEVARTAEGVDLAGTRGIHHSDEWASIERIAPPLPTKPGAVIFPHAPEQWKAFLLDEDSKHWISAGVSIAEPDAVREALADGTHYIAFEGVDV